MDQAVLKVQQWLNGNYKNKTGYSIIKEDGVTGWGTITALTKALQIELGISTPNGTFGPATKAAFGNLSINSQPQNSWSEAEILSLQNKIYILQGALYCKGYNGDFTGKFTTTTESAIKELQTDAGLTTVNGIVDSILMKSLLSMDAFKLLNYGDYNGKDIIRKIQQYLNKKYLSNKYFANDLGIVPCDGIYSRSTNKALLYGLQIEEGINGENGATAPNGVFGPTTKKLCKVIPAETTESRFVYLLQAALYCNGEDTNGFDGGFGEGTINAINSFQSFTNLPVDGSAGKQTWASLLVSCGDPLRKGIACDTDTKITDAIAQTIKKDGRSYVGRYLTGKYRLTPTELNTIYKNGLKLIPLMQGLSDEKYYFSSSVGLVDANNALDVAKLLGFSKNTVIYFAIDYDALTGDLPKYIEPYFKSIQKAFNNTTSNPNKYRIGVYAPRAICTALANKGYTCSSYVSDMSTGFSSNLGQRLPQNWSFDQIYEYTSGIGTGAGYLKMDNVIARSGHIECCQSVNSISQANYNQMEQAINSNPLLKTFGLELSGVVGTLWFKCNEHLKIYVDVGTKCVVNDDADATIQVKEFKLDGAEFKSALDGVKAGLSADQEVQLSAAIKLCENIEATGKISVSPDTIKIEIESTVENLPTANVPLIVTLCIEIKNDKNNSTSNQASSIVETIESLAYNTVNGAIAIGEKVALVVAAVATVAIVLYYSVPVFISLLASKVVISVLAIFILVGNILSKLLNSNSNNI